MKKIFFCVSAILISSALFAQEFSDDDFFFSDDEGIVELEAIQSDKENKSSDLSHGVLFENGSVKIGGSFDLSLGTTTNFPSGKNFGDALWETSLTPTADASITLDARPTENLRMYMKTGVCYPYVTKGNASLSGKLITYRDLMNKPDFVSVMTTTDLSIRNMFYVKELFSDFSLGDNVAFRFGKQTVTWGVGYFYSPADVINAAIDPENPTIQVEGPLCLRTQIVFPGTQNALWAYIIPDNDFSSANLENNYARNTALAAKGEFVIGGWELGLGTWYRYNRSPKIMATTTGTIFKKISVFGEAVCGFGQDSEWVNDKDKTIFGQGTVGFMYNWKNPQITFMGQYYYSGEKDSVIEEQQKLLSALPEYADQAAQLDLLKRNGHNVALAVNFGKIISNDISASLYCIGNFTNETLISSAMMTYTPAKEIKISFGPYLSWIDFDKDPVVAAKLLFNLGGGKF
ncbi:MAG: hypothetical protein MJ182_05890 [Treponema sp.]|nr:hypothetical protein [Treponema sp.]